jgi:hypothetical protein
LLHLPQSLQGAGLLAQGADYYGGDQQHQELAGEG